MLVPEELGGNGYGHYGLGLVLQALGRTLAASPLQSTVVLAGSTLQLAGEQPAARHGCHALRRAMRSSPSPSRNRRRMRRTAARRALCGPPVAGSWMGASASCWTGMSPTVCWWLARTDGAADDARGLSLFLLDPSASRRHASIG